MLQPYQSVVEQPWALLRSTLQQVADDITAGTLITSAAAPVRSEPPRNGAVAVIPIHGMIEHRGSVLGELFGGTSIESVRASFRAALASPDVVAVVLDIDSPGGTVAGVTELASEIRAARGQKPIAAVANTLAASAAYWIGSQADEFYASPSAEVGSIGVYAAYIDHSEELANDGVKVTVISAGERKAKALGVAPLDDEAMASMQRRVDASYAQFVNDVAAGRRVRASEVLEGYGKGDTLMANDAHAAGMVDGVATLDTVIRNVARSTRAVRAIHAEGEVTQQRAEADEADEHIPLRIAVANLATDGALLSSRLEARAALRAKEGRPSFHPSVIEQLRSIRASISTLIGPDEPGDDVTTGQADEPPEPAAAVAAPVQAQPAPQPKRFRDSEAWARYVNERTQW